MSNNLSVYTDIDQKINLIYNYLYDESVKNCYKVDSININSITFDDIKISKDNEIFVDVLKDFKNGSFQFIVENSNTLVFKRFSDSFPLNIYITPYLKNSDISNKLSYNNKESHFSYVLSKLVLDRKTENILLPILNFDIEFNDLEFMLKSNNINKKLKDLINEEKITNTFSVNIKSQIFKFDVLGDYIKKNKDINYKSIIFQLLHTLAVIQNDYKDFSHNDLKLSNILVEHLDDIVDKKYSFNNNNYEIKNQNVIVKLTSFGKSESDIILKGSKTSNDKNVDILNLFNILKKIKDVDSETLNFIKNNISNNKVSKSAAELLNNSYFNELKINEKKSSKDNYMKNILEKKNSKKSKERVFMTNLESDSKSIFGDQEEIKIKRNDVTKKGSKKLSRKINKKDKSNTILKRYIEQKGGNDRITSAPYQKVKNDPYVSNDARETFNKRKDEEGKPKEKSNEEKPFKKDFENKKFNKEPKQLNTETPITESTDYQKKYNKDYEKKPYNKDYEKKPYNKDYEKKPYSTESDSYEKKPYNTESDGYDKKSFKKNYDNKEFKKEYDSKSNNQSLGKYSDFIPYELPIQNQFQAHTHLPYNYDVRKNVNVIKPVNISFSNPVGGSHMTINRVYEDMLPGDRFGFTLKSLFERRQLTNFIRNMILENGDGEELSISAGSKKTLLSYIKLLEVNPFSIQRNPYKSLSKGFLLYTSAYPIRHDVPRNQLEIAKLSMGINVRLYELSYGAEKCFNIGSQIDCDNFDVWREIKYYEYVREEILKKKVSPNFVGLYLYTIDSTSRIDYNKLNMIKYNSYPKDMLKNETLNLKKINNLHEMDPLEFLVLNSYGVQQKKTSSTDNLIDHSKVTEKKVQETVKYLIRYKYVTGYNSNWKWTEEGIKFLGNKGYFSFITSTANQPFVGSQVKPEEVKVLASLIGKQDLSFSIGKSLIALTESPNSNILKWASPVSDNYGTVQKMIETGYHTPDTWKSVLFQLVYACAVLQEKGIYFEKFSLENNVYIKDLFTQAEKRDHWIYKVNGLNYYVPNYGYLLMIDSNFADIVNGESILYKNNSNSNEPLYKIKSDNLFQDKNNFDDKDTIKQKMLYAFKSIINKDNFNNNLFKLGGEIPDQSILNLLENMYNSDLPNIKDYLEVYFKEYLNNRLGTYLSQEEAQLISLIPNFSYKKGDLIVYQERYNEFKWAIFIDDDSTTNKKKILTDPKIDPISVYGHSIFKLPEGEVINQNNNKGINYDTNFTIETYCLDN